jgi:hypothetical protein
VVGICGGQHVTRIPMLITPWVGRHILTQEYGTESVNQSVRKEANPAGISQTSIPSKKRKLTILKAEPIQFDIDFTIDSPYKIKGKASSPNIDREKEKILLHAFNESLPNFMKAPILHVQHTERPIGTITKAEVKDDGLYIESNIFEHCDDIWKDIESGELSKFSIYGVRKAGTFSCQLDPNQRTEPCITKSLDLWSISLVGDNAINQDTWLDIVKSYDDFYKNNEILIKSEDTTSTLMHTVTDGRETMDDEKDKKKLEEKSDGSHVDDQQADQAVLDDQAAGMELIKEPTNLSSIMDRLGKMEETIKCFTESRDKTDEVDKGEDMTETEVKPEEKEEKCSETKKAEEVPKEPDVVQKAELETISKAIVADITKAFDERFKKVEADIESMKKETIQKGGNVVVLMDELKKFSEDSPGVANLKAIGEMK